MKINNNPNTSIIPTQTNTISQSQSNNNKKQKRNILTEEEFTAILSTIIQRDYYPSIPSLHRDASVLKKRSENDTAGAIAIRKAARKLELQEEKLNMMIKEPKYVELADTIKKVRGTIDSLNHFLVRKKISNYKK